MPKPALIICPVDMEDAPNTIALGAVATGSMKAYEEVKATGMIRYRGFSQMVNDKSARIGKSTLAVAVFEAT